MAQNTIILIFEDNASLAETYITELKNAGVSSQIKLVQDLSSFLKTVSQIKPHLVLLSGRVPGLGEIMLGLHEQHYISAPVIIIGEKEREADYRELIKHGAYDYVARENIYRLAHTSRNALTMETYRRELIGGT